MIKIERATSENWPKLEQLFLGSEECSDCWCMNHRSNPTTCPTGDAAKSALRSALATGEASGLLAFINEEPAGWCAIDPSSTQVGHDYYLETVSASESSWMIHCLYVDPKYRGQGVSVALMEAAIELAKSNGAKEVLGFPIPEDSAGKFPANIAEFSGRLSTFKKLGFAQTTRLNDFYQVVSKLL